MIAFFYGSTCVFCVFSFLFQDPHDNYPAPGSAVAPTRFDSTAAAGRVFLEKSGGAFWQVEVDEVQLEKQADAEREYEKVLFFLIDLKVCNTFKKNFFLLFFEYLTPFCNCPFFIS